MAFVAWGGLALAEFEGDVYLFGEFGAGFLYFFVVGVGVPDDADGGDGFECGEEIEDQFGGGGVEVVEFDVEGCGRVGRLGVAFDPIHDGIEKGYGVFGETTAGDLKDVFVFVQDHLWCVVAAFHGEDFHIAPINAGLLFSDYFNSC